MLSTSELIFVNAIKKRTTSVLLVILITFIGLSYSVNDGHNIFYFFSLASSFFIAVVINDILLFLIRQAELSKYIVVSLCISIIIMIGMWLLVDIDVAKMIYIHFKYAIFISLGVLGNSWFVIYYKKETQAEERVEEQNQNK